MGARAAAAAARRVKGNGAKTATDLGCANGDTGRYIIVLRRILKLSPGYEKNSTRQLPPCGNYRVYRGDRVVVAASRTVTAGRRARWELKAQSAVPNWPETFARL